MENRFFACALGGGHLWKALAYVERNPVRAHMALRATDYPWSSAAAHVSGADPLGILDLDWWRQEGSITDWRDILHGAELEEDIATLRGCTYAGRPFGDERFVKEMSERFGRQWIRGRPKKQGRALSVNDVAAKCVVLGSERVRKNRAVQAVPLPHQPTGVLNRSVFHKGFFFSPA
jgi:putative transposase